MPYQEHLTQYSVAPYFIWQSVHAQPIYHHEILRIFYVDWELVRYSQTRTVLGGARKLGLSDSGGIGFFYLGPALTAAVVITILTAPYGTRWSDFSRKLQFLIALSAVFIFASRLGNTVDPTLRRATNGRNVRHSS